MVKGKKQLKENSLEIVLTLQSPSESGVEYLKKIKLKITKINFFLLM